MRMLFVPAGLPPGRSTLVCKSVPTVGIIGYTARLLQLFPSRSRQVTLEALSWGRVSTLLWVSHEAIMPATGCHAGVPRVASAMYATLAGQAASSVQSLLR